MTPRSIVLSADGRRLPIYIDFPELARMQIIARATLQPCACDRHDAYLRIATVHSYVQLHIGTLSYYT